MGSMFQRGELCEPCKSKNELRHTKNVGYCNQCRNRWWWYSIHLKNGKNESKSLRTTNERIATQKLLDLEKLVESGSQSPSESPEQPLKVILSEYESYCMARNAEKTVHDDIKRLRDFFNECNIQFVSDVNIRNLSSYLDNRISSVKKSTANRIIVNMKTFMNFCLDREIIKINPIARMKAYGKLEKNPVRFYTKDQVEKLLVAAESLGVEYLKLIGIGVYTGARISEILSLEWQDFNFERKILTISNKEASKTKSRKFRVVPIAVKLSSILLPARAKSGLCVFPEREFTTPPKHHLYQIQKKAGLKEEGFHILRHTFGARLAQEGVSLFKIKEWMGHASVRTTEIYMHLIPAHDNDIERL